MTQQKQIEQAERAIEIQQATINSYQASIKHAEKRIQEWQKHLADLKKQPEPKEGEWWFSKTTPVNCIFKISKVDTNSVNHSEYYSERMYFPSGCIYKKDLTRPATEEEITYFMGLHAERLGMKEGVTIDQKDGVFSIWKILSIKKFEFIPDGRFVCWGTTIDEMGRKDDIGYIEIRDINGNWATVVKEEPKPVKNGKLKAKIAELQAQNKSLMERLNKARAALDGTN